MPGGICCCKACGSSIIMGTANVVLSIITLVVGVMKSSQYDIEHKAEPFALPDTSAVCTWARLLENESIRKEGLCCLRALSHKPQDPENSWEAFEKWGQVEMGTPAECLEHLSTKLFMAKSVRYIETQHVENRAGKLRSLCWTVVRSSQVEPVFWKTHRWMTFMGDKILRFLHLGLPPAISESTPTGLLVGWIAIALGAVLYHESCLRHKYRTSFLLGSSLCAILIAVTEHLDLSTTVLTNIPWCLALGILADVAVHEATSIMSHSQATRERSNKGALDTQEGKSGMIP